MEESKRGLTNGNAQAVGANEVLAAVAAGDLLAVAADGAVLLGLDVDLGVAGLLSDRSGLGGGDLGGGGGLVVAGSGGDDGGHGGDEESLDEGHFVGWLGWWGGGGFGWWSGSECVGLDELDDEKKLGWRAMEMGVLIPFGRRLWSSGYLVVSMLPPLLFLCLVRFRCCDERPLFCVIAWASLLWRCQSLVDPRVSLYGAGGVA